MRAHTPTRTHAHTHAVSLPPLPVFHSSQLLNPGLWNGWKAPEAGFGASTLPRWRGGEGSSRSHPGSPGPCFLLRSAGQAFPRASHRPRCLLYQAQGRLRSCHCTSGPDRLCLSPALSLALGGGQPRSQRHSFPSVFPFLGARSGPGVRSGLPGPWGASGQSQSSPGRIFVILSSSFQEHTQDHSPEGMALRGRQAGILNPASQ